MNYSTPTHHVLRFALRVAVAVGGVAVVAVLSAAARGQTPDRGPSTEPPQRLVVATREVPPFALRDADGRWSGIAVELLTDAYADWSTDSTSDIEFRELGLEPMLDAVAAAEVDVAAGAITVNYDREKRMDFSHPFYKSGLAIAVGPDQRGGGLGGLLGALLSWTFLEIVAGLLAAMLVSAVLVYVFERRKNREQFGGSAPRGVAKALWWAAVTLTTVGYGDKAPRTLPGRLVATVWMFAGLFIIASFTAAVTSTMTVTQLQSRIAGPNDLRRVRVATVEGSTAEAYLRRRRLSSRGVGDAREALELLRDGRVDAVVYDAPILRYEVLENFGGELFVLPGTFDEQDYAFALPEGSELRERLNQAVLRRVASPEWAESLRRYLGEEPE